MDSFDDFDDFERGEDKESIGGEIAGEAAEGCLEVLFDGLSILIVVLFLIF